MSKEKPEEGRGGSVFSIRFRAGRRRTYFFDVKPAKSKDYFLVITESKRQADGTYERYKIFLYKEDFKKFIDSLNQTFEHIRTQLMPDYDFEGHKEPAASSETSAEEEGGLDNSSEENPPERPPAQKDSDPLRW
ncbi:MAG: PUR family DNA/RNA-binding protein [Chitinophagales bacterium]|nr:PUR family DNA/RNA-binding protein [Chitinophagales bacterium]MDW8427908.1 DUF3276 family protein [Chitinophagales bacterium]